MLAKLWPVLSLIIIVTSTAQAIDINNINLKLDWTFKDYIQKFKPSVVWREIEDHNKRNDINNTLNDEFDTVYNRIDETDELLNLQVRNGDPKMLLQKDGRRWRPPRGFVNHKYDIFSIRRRLLELMKQAIYQVRNKMILMQIMREKYNKIAVYKMGFLMSKTDTACKTFATFAFKAFKSCSLSRQWAIRSHPLIDILEASERLLDLWFDVDLLVDLITINNENCKRMLQQVMTNRKHAWKFVD